MYSSWILVSFVMCSLTMWKENRLLFSFSISKGINWGKFDDQCYTGDWIRCKGQTLPTLALRMLHEELKRPSRTAVQQKRNVLRYHVIEYHAFLVFNCSKDVLTAQWSGFNKDWSPIKLCYSKVYSNHWTVWHLPTPREGAVLWVLYGWRCH